jgi:2-polyprenyl-3-methyl-5-hydroxy-6-metoxy-1,4-benzoquinol methylase
MSRTRDSGLNCLLCASGNIAIRDTLRAEEILSCWANVGHQFSSSVTRPFLQAGMIHLYDCLQCGFQFFNPKLGGSAEFYEQLHAKGSDYYAPNRPENERNVQFAIRQKYRTVLDVGCGPGFALDAAKRAGLETFGIELSRTAAAEASKRGHMIFPVLLEKMDAVWEGKFDLISLNQVLEHVPDPCELVKQCIRFLSPRGAIAIAVPGATGILRFNPWLQANWPPHHLSRWRKRDFHQLAQRVGLRAIKTGGNQLLGSEIEVNLLGHRELCRILQKPYHGLPPVAIRAVCLFYRKAGLKYLFNSQGHSIYCCLGRPAVVSETPKSLDLL